MNLPKDIKYEVRMRANFACEYCSVKEEDIGAELTIDHFQPISKGGDNDLNNLIYCCHKCNNYKFNYEKINEQLVNLVSDQNKLLSHQQELLRILLFPI